MIKELVNTVMKDQKKSLIEKKDYIEYGINSHIESINYLIKKLNEKLEMLAEVKQKIELIDKYEREND